MPLTGGVTLKEDESIVGEGRQAEYSADRLLVEVLPRLGELMVLNNRHASARRPFSRKTTLRPNAGQILCGG